MQQLHPVKCLNGHTSLYKESCYYPSRRAETFDFQKAQIFKAQYQKAQILLIFPICVLFDITGFNACAWHEVQLGITSRKIYSNEI